MFPSGIPGSHWLKAKPWQFWTEAHFYGGRPLEANKQKHWSHSHRRTPVINAKSACTPMSQVTLWWEQPSWRKQGRTHCLFQLLLTFWDLCVGLTGGSYTLPVPPRKPCGCTSATSGWVLLAWAAANEIQHAMFALICFDPEECSEILHPVWQTRTLPLRHVHLSLWPCVVLIPLLEESFRFCSIWLHLSTKTVVNGCALSASTFPTLWHCGLASNIRKASWD